MTSWSRARLGGRGEVRDSFLTFSPLPISTLSRGQLLHERYNLGVLVFIVVDSFTLSVPRTRAGVCIMTIPSTAHGQRALRTRRAPMTTTRLQVSRRGIPMPSGVLPFQSQHTLDQDIATMGKASVTRAPSKKRPPRAIKPYPSRPLCRGITRASCRSVYHHPTQGRAAVEQASRSQRVLGSGLHMLPRSIHPRRSNPSPHARHPGRAGAPPTISLRRKYSLPASAAGGAAPPDLTEHAQGTRLPPLHLGTELGTS